MLCLAAAALHFAGPDLGKVSPYPGSAAHADKDPLENPLLRFRELVLGHNDAVWFIYSVFK